MGKKNGWNKSRKKKGASTLERKLLLKYLQSYKEKVISLYNSTSSSSKQRQDVARSSSSNIQPTIIDGVQLKNFEIHDLLEQPFLSLPKELSGYHRSLVHDICTDTLHLFHCGIDGANEGERFVAVSVYSDGLAHVPGIAAIDSIASTALQMGTFKPWVMKKDVNSSWEIEEGKKMIAEMIDQPGRCLRDAYDAIDLLQIRYDNLSTIKPPEEGDIKCMLVDSAEKIQRCIQDLENNKPTEIAFDLECYNKGKDLQMTCLIQIATNDGRTYIIDVLGGSDGEVWDRVHGLASVFADSSIVKIGHGIRGLDVQSLQRDFGIFVVNAFDTYEAANVLNLEGKGLAMICARYGLQNSELYNDLKRKYQATDWTKRPLTGPMILYGRYDVHYLIHLRRVMMRDLIIRDLAQSTTVPDTSEISFDPTKSIISASSSLGHMVDASNEEDEVERGGASQDFLNTNSQNSNNDSIISNEKSLPITNDQLFHAEDLRRNPKLIQVLSKSQENCLKFWSFKPEPPLKNKQFLLLAAQYRRDGKALTKSQLSLYHKLASWREDLANEEESLPGIICSLGYLARVAFHRPVAETGLRKINYNIPRFLIHHNRRYMKEMFSFLRDSLADDNVVEDDICPTFKEFKERLEKKKVMEFEKKIMELLSIEKSKTNASSNNDSILSNPMFWAVSCATISVLICGFVGDRKRRR